MMERANATVSRVEGIVHHIHTLSMFISISGSSPVKDAPCRSSKSVRPLPPSESTAYGYYSQSESEGATKVSAEDGSTSLFLPPGSGLASGQLQPPLGAGAQFQPLRLASVDESKMSAFSPILSSSRMDQTRFVRIGSSVGGDCRFMLESEAMCGDLDKNLH